MATRTTSGGPSARLAAPEWIEGRERETVVVWGADWRGFRHRLLGRLDELEPEAWYPVEGVAAWTAARDPDLLGPTFAASPQTMFGDDRFHPSAAGYRTAAEAVLPSALAALGLRPRPATSEPVPAVQAAAVAAYRPGTEVSAAGRRKRVAPSW